MATPPPTGVDEEQRPTADPPPPTHNKTVDEVVADMKKMPLFMTSLDDLDDDNSLLEAMAALAYEGTRAEVADNFRAQGNDCVRAKQWRDAREFYSKALAALKSPSQPPPPDAEVVEVDEEAEAKRERTLEEACYANRALCNLEMKNYGSCNRDCAAALRVHPRNVKAWYRAASACLALDRLPEALDACRRGLECDAHNAALQTLLQKVEKRTAHVAELDQVRREREQHTAREAATLKLALQQRHIATRSTKTTPDLEDAAIRLASPLDASSALTLPLVLLYPLHAQSDFVKACAETDTLAQHLTYIFPLPWDAGHEYTVQSVECYMETTQGGLIKAGKNLSVVTLLGSGKVEVVDGLVRVNVVPKARGKEWIADFKRRSGRTW
ncbi:HSP70/90 co-chaperone [Teratosphaeriaceae sp. CCFEE 6253]|nr:HSP70/90 co-chaperone [Teratosphaeriaceae sp. CCFEE 6253]